MRTAVSWLHPALQAPCIRSCGVLPLRRGGQPQPALIYLPSKL